MSLIQKYIWMVKTIHRAGRITLKELNEKWRNNVDLSRGEDLPRQTFDRWKGGILDMFGIVIECEAKGGHHYYIANPSVMDRGELRTWLLDTYGTAEALSNNLAIHDRILMEDIPSSQDFLTMVLEAMKENRVLEITHRAFTVNEAKTYLALLREVVRRTLVYVGEERGKRPLAIVLIRPLGACPYYGTEVRIAQGFRRQGLLCRLLWHRDRRECAAATDCAPCGQVPPVLYAHAADALFPTGTLLLR